MVLASLGLALLVCITPWGGSLFLSSPPVVTSAAFLIPNQLHFVEELNLKINSSSSRIKGSENHAILAGFPVTIRSHVKVMNERCLVVLKIKLRIVCLLNKCQASSQASMSTFKETHTSTLVLFLFIYLNACLF